MGGKRRGQTTLDFAVGMSTFLLVVAFTLTFVPSMIQPFTATDQENTVVADRVADQLAEGMLVVDTSDPYVLDKSCTEEFFKTDPDTGPDCNFDQTTDLSRDDTDLSDRVGLDSWQRINVQLRGDDVDDDRTHELLCVDGSGDVHENEDQDGNPVSCVTQFNVDTSNSPPTDSRSVVVARRVVTIDGRDATLLVRVW